MSLLGSEDTLNGLTEASGVRWYGHDLRRDNGDVIRKALGFELVERRKRERQNMTRKRQVEEHDDQIGLFTEDAIDNNKAA